MIICMKIWRLSIGIAWSTSGDRMRARLRKLIYVVRMGLSTEQKRGRGSNVFSFGRRSAGRRREVEGALQFTAAQKGDLKVFEILFDSLQQGFERRHILAR